MTNRRKGKSVGIGGSIVALLMLVGFLMVVWFFVNSLFAILSWVAPVLLLITFFLKRQVITNYISFIANTFKQNVGMGLLYSIGTFFLFPLVTGYLFVKALIAYQLEKKFGPAEEKFSQYEEVEEDEDDEDFLDLPELEKSQGGKDFNEYEDLL